MLKGTEVKDTFSFEEIKKIKVGFSIAPFRIVIILNDEIIGYLIKWIVKMLKSVLSFMKQLIAINSDLR